MAVRGQNRLLSQVRGLAYKHFLATVVRRPIIYILSGYIFPIGLLALLLCIPYFKPPDDGNGIGSIAELPSLNDAIGNKPLVLVKLPGLGSDVGDVFSKIQQQVPADKVKVLEDEVTLARECISDVRGLTPCSMSLTIYDSPLTTGGSGNHTWNYTIRGQPAYSGNTFHVMKHDDDVETRYMPLQQAVENAMINRTAKISAMMFTQYIPDKSKQTSHDASLVVSLAGFAMIASFNMFVYHLSASITRDREAGMSSLIDAMGGSATTRVISTLLAFDAIYFPTWIIFGVLQGILLFPLTGVGIPILWQILTGLSVNSFTAFLSAYFDKARSGTSYITIFYILLSLITSYLCGDMGEHRVPGLQIAFIVLFPISNFNLFALVAANYQDMKLPISLSERLVRDLGFEIIEAPMALGVNLAIMVAQIFVYAGLAIWLERSRNGIDYKNRKFSTQAEDQSLTVVETHSLVKRFGPSASRKFFCCGRGGKRTLAVDQVSISGQRGQILCLVGPNGSGKTTTLQMIAGLEAPTSGSVTVNALASQIGICPQRNTFWDRLTVREHMSLWSRIKAGGESAGELQRLVEACDLVGKEDCLASALSGGQKRKLQLACMFIGNPSVCLIDECTSGLDPLSRRAIWDILLEQRAKRSIILTTHFLDEVDVLADRIVVLTKGVVKAEGPTAQLKQQYGGGYRVFVPLDAVPSAEMLNPPYESTIHQDHQVYITPDSRSAAIFATQLGDSGVRGVTISGPQVEDVFLRVADDEEFTNSLRKVEQAAMQLTPGRTTSFWSQVGTMLWKRAHVMKRSWWPYLWVLVLPLAILPALLDLLKHFEPPICAYVPSQSNPGVPIRVGGEFASYYSWTKEYSQLVIGGPDKTADGVRAVVANNYTVANFFNTSMYDEVSHRVNSVDDFVGYITQNHQDIVMGIYLDPATNTRTVAYSEDEVIQRGMGGLNLLSQAESGVEISAGYARFASIPRVSPKTLPASSLRYTDLLISSAL
jgi:ABC-type multidrug transport system ATPase subunit